MLGAFGFVALAGLAFVSNSKDDSPGPAKQAPETHPAPESDHDVLLRNTKSEAVYAAMEIIKDRLAAPSQAKFVSKKLLESRENFALTHLIVDAPNRFGVMLRKGHCVVVQFQPPRGDNYLWSRTAGVVGCEDLPDEAAAWAIKMANGWPDIDRDPVPPGMQKAFDEGQKRRSRHRN